MTYLRDETDVQLSRYDPPTRVWAGKVATNASNFEDKVSVTITGTDGGTLRWEDVRWQPRNNSQLPKRGDVCVIVTDDNGEMWIPVWWPTELMTGGDADIYTGTATPDEDVGKTGDFYIDTNDDIIYGPKEGDGDWPIAMRGAGQYVLPGRLSSQGVLCPGNDCNQAYEGGWYQCQGSANGPPTGGWGHLFVVPWETTYQGQTFYTLGNNHVWYRDCYAGTWKAWSQIYPIDNDGLPSRIQISQQPGSAASVSDLNNATQSGFYTTLSSPANAPEASNFWHLVVIQRGDGWSAQIATSFYGSRTYVRTWESGWTAWKKISPIDDGNLPKRLGTATTTVNSEVTNWNDATENGWYQAFNATNAPTGGWYIGQVVSYRALTPTRYVTQEVWTFTDNTGLRYRRNCINDAWSGWWQVYPITGSGVVIDDSNLPDRLESSGIYYGDLNTADLAGWFNYSPGTANAPVASTYGMVQVLKMDANWTTQIAYEWNVTNVYMRRKFNGIWTSWYKTWPLDASAVPVLGDANLPARLKTGAAFSSIAGGNANTAVQNGWYFANAATANVPAAGDWYIEVLSHDGTNYIAKQTARNYYNTEVYERVCYSGSWTGWTKKWPLDAASVPVNDTNLPLRLQGAHTYATDLNNHWEAGWYAFSVSTTNRPADAYGFCHVLNLGSGNVLQKAYQYNDNREWYRRRIDGGAWGTWIAGGASATQYSSYESPETLNPGAWDLLNALPYFTIVAGTYDVDWGCFIDGGGYVKQVAIRDPVSAGIYTGNAARDTAANGSCLMRSHRFTLPAGNLHLAYFTDSTAGTCYHRWIRATRVG